MFAIALRILFCLIGAGFFVGSIVNLVQTYSFPVAKNELLDVSGTLNTVSVCTGGRYRSFKFTIMRSNSPIKFRLGCPSTTYTKLRESIGKKVQMSYHNKRGSFLEPILDVYELSINESPFIKYEDRVAYHNRVKPYLILMPILSGLLGLAIIVMTQKIFLEVYGTD